MFNPKESIDFNGNTGPFIQYSYARIQPIMRKAGEMDLEVPNHVDGEITLSETETSLIQTLNNYGNVIKQAGTDFSPALIANYAFELAKAYNSFYHDYPILKEEDKQKQDVRLMLSAQVAKIIKSATHLLGIEVPERM